MSYETRERVKRTQYLWDTLSAEEKTEIYDWCTESDKVAREQYPTGDIDAIVSKMSDGEFQSFFNKFMERYRLRKKRRSSTIDMLRAEGTAHANAQADKLEEEQRVDDERAKEIEAEQH